MRGTQIKQADEVRVFAHDAKPVTFAATISGTERRGVALYVGAGPADVTVVMESGETAIFKAVPAGTFMPILVTEVTTASGATAADILALY